MGKTNPNSALRKNYILISKENPFLYQQVMSYEVNESDKDVTYRLAAKTDSHNWSETQMSGPQNPNLSGSL